MKIRKIFLPVLFLLAGISENLSAQQTTTLKATIENYARDKVSLSFMQTPSLNIDFPYNRENPQPIDYMFDIDKPEAVYLNGQLIYVEPGDEMEFLFYYGEDRKLKEIRVLSGSNPQTVAANTLLQQVRLQRLENRFKTQNLAWVAIALPPREHFSKNLRRIESEQAFWNANKEKLTNDAYHYLLSESEALVYANMIDYPLMFSDVQKKPLDSCLVNEYAHFLDGYTVREDEASLRNRNYGVFLISLYDYARMKDALKKGNITNLNHQTPEELFNGLALYYSGAVRDAVLYCMLVQTLSANKMEFSAFEKLYEKYIRQYNSDAFYKADLERMMQ